MSDIPMLTGPNGGELVFDIDSGTITEKLTGGNLGEPQLYLHGERICSESDFLRVKDRIATLEAELAASREREAALAAALAELPIIIDKMWTTQVSAEEFRALSDRRTAIGLKPSVALAAHDAAIERKAKAEEGSRLLALVRDHDLLHALMSSDIFCRDLSLRDEYAQRKAKVEALRGIQYFEPPYDPPADGNCGRLDHYERGRTDAWSAFETEIITRIAALQAEGGKTNG